MMRGPVGSEIIITVVREGVEEPFDVSIIRDTIKVTAVRPRPTSQGGRQGVSFARAIACERGRG